MKLNDRKGQAMVELALVLPLLLLIVFGITEFGRALWIVNTLTNAAREGARRASVSPGVPLNTVQLEDRIKECIPFDQTDLDIDIAPISPVHGIDTITVVVNLPFQSSVPIIDMLNGITLKGEASMLYE